MLEVLEVANMGNSIKNIELVPIFGDFSVNSNIEDLFFLVIIIFLHREKRGALVCNNSLSPFKAKNTWGVF